ncbi:16S rRNA (guanine(966)-N(2))-methyltransferase RsmD [Chloroflexota bacterium]
MRVVAGKAKGRRLNPVPGDIVRPITDRAKESLFNILRPDLPGCAFLDLFAGTGSVGIEALSQGAEFARFIDRYRPSIQIIQQNLLLTGLEEGAEVLMMSAFELLAKTPDRAFDYVYIAPPQYKNMWRVALQNLDQNPSWVVEDGWVVVQIDPTEYDTLELKNFSEFDQRKYGSVFFVFYEREP